MIIYVITETFSDGTSSNKGYTTNYEEAVAIVKKFREFNHRLDPEDMSTICVEELTELKLSK